MGGENQQPEISEIVVTGYSARYAAAVRKLLGVEGGFADDPVDRGGTTKFGISLRFLKAEGRIDLDGDGIADFDLDMDGDIDGADIRKLRRGDAVYLYHRCFWKPLDCESLPPLLGEAMFDQAVNGGMKAARKLLQRAVNRMIATRAGQAGAPAVLKVDGDIGGKTKAATAWAVAISRTLLLQYYREEAANRYRAIVAADPSQRRFLKGWLARAAELGKA